MSSYVKITRARQKTNIVKLRRRINPQTRSLPAWHLSRFAMPRDAFVVEQLLNGRDICIFSYHFEKNQLLAHLDAEWRLFVPSDWNAEWAPDARVNWISLQRHVFTAGCHCMTYVVRHLMFNMLACTSPSCAQSPAPVITRSGAWAFVAGMALHRLTSPASGHSSHRNLTARLCQLDLLWHVKHVHMAI